MEFPRALSIGGTRVWVTGEILTAANMNQYISQVMEDLAGRNGLIEFEDSISFPDSATNPFRLPRGTTGQRPASPLNAMMRYNTTLNQVEFYNGSWTPLPTDAATFSYLNSQGLIGTGPGQLAVGDHGHVFSQPNFDGDLDSMPSVTVTTQTYNLAYTSPTRVTTITPGATSDRFFVGFVVTVLIGGTVVGTTDVQIRRQVGSFGSSLTFADFDADVIASAELPAGSGSQYDGVLALQGFDEPATTSTTHW